MSGVRFPHRPQILKPLFCNSYFSLLEEGMEHYGILLYNKNMDFNGSSSSIIIDDGKSEVGYDKQTEIKKRIMRRFSSSSNQLTTSTTTTATGADRSDLSQPLAQSRR